MKNSHEICTYYNSKYVPPELDSTLGLGKTSAAVRPINGLRHLPTNKMNGWFIYTGTSPIPQGDKDFFEPVHTVHISEKFPEVTPYLALEPGWRFLIDGDYVDVWYDESLLVK
jgi:hypothetical protein